MQTDFSAQLLCPLQLKLGVCSAIRGSGCGRRTRATGADATAGVGAICGCIGCGRRTGATSGGASAGAGAISGWMTVGNGFAIIDG